MSTALVRQESDTRMDFGRTVSRINRGKELNALTSLGDILPRTKEILRRVDTMDLTTIVDTMKDYDIKIEKTLITNKNDKKTIECGFWVKNKNDEQYPENPIAFVSGYASTKDGYIVLNGDTRKDRLSMMELILNMNQLKYLVPYGAEHDKAVEKASKNIDRNKALFEENEKITKNTFEMCQSLGMENGRKLSTEEINNFKILRQDIEHSGEKTERYFVQTKDNKEYAEITEAGVYLDSNATNQTITHKHKLKNALNVQSLVKKMSESIKYEWTEMNVRDNSCHD